MCLKQRIDKEFYPHFPKTRQKLKKHLKAHSLILLWAASSNQTLVSSKIEAGCVCVCLFPSTVDASLD